MYISIEFETENYRLLMFSDEEFILLDLKNKTFEKLDICWHTGLIDLLDFVVIHTDNEFVVGYLNKMLDIVDDEDDVNAILYVLGKYESEV